MILHFSQFPLAVLVLEFRGITQFLGLISGSCLWDLAFEVSLDN